MGTISTATTEKNQRPIPEAALRDEDAIEMLRVWISENVPRSQGGTNSPDNAVHTCRECNQNAKATPS